MDGTVPSSWSSLAVSPARCATPGCQNLIGGRWVPRATRRRSARWSAPTPAPLWVEVELSDRGRRRRAPWPRPRAAFPGLGAPCRSRSGRGRCSASASCCCAHLDELANTAALEAGKTRAEARAGLEKGIEVVEFALALQNLDEGAALEVSRGVRCEARREPLGVVAGITPFNFPAMVPLWMFPIAVTVGQRLHPEAVGEGAAHGRPPGRADAGGGLPAGRVLHRPRRQARRRWPWPITRTSPRVAFVGSTAAARAVYTRATALRQAGAVPGRRQEPHPGGARRRRGDHRARRGRLVHRLRRPALHGRERAAGGGTGRAIWSTRSSRRAAADRARRRAWAPSSTRAARERIVGGHRPRRGRRAPRSCSTAAARAAARRLRGGNWLGPTVIDRARPDMECARSRAVRPGADRHPRAEPGRGAGHRGARAPTATPPASSPPAARWRALVSERATSGMIGVNIGVPVPREPFSFGGAKESKFGEGDITGRPGRRVLDRAGRRSPPSGTLQPRRRPGCPDPASRETAGRSAVSTSTRPTQAQAAKIVLTSHPGRHGPKPVAITGAPPIPWSAARSSRTVSNLAQRNVIGTHSGSYSVYRALAVAAGALDPLRKPDLTNTAPGRAHRPAPAVVRSPAHRLDRSRSARWSARRSQPTSTRATTSAPRSPSPRRTSACPSSTTPSTPGA